MKNVDGISKKAPCPCGSGRKFGDCCGILAKQEYDGSGIPYFALCKSIAYKGKIGRAREQFCIKYFDKKRQRLHDLHEALILAESETKQKITCHKGCSYCCSFYIEASVQECEIIVYYLYHNPNLLISFLQTYPKWREKIKNNGDLIKGRGRFWNAKITPQNAKSLWQEVGEEEQKYLAQDIPCPFLFANSCSIYNFRPYTCAAYVAVTPNEWCKPDSKNQKKILKAFAQEVLFDRSFYYVKELENPILFPMQLGVYEILKCGLSYFSIHGVKGLENLDQEWFSDSEVRAIYQKYERNYSTN